MNTQFNRNLPEEIADGIRLYQAGEKIAALAQWKALAIRDDVIGLMAQRCVDLISDASRAEVDFPAELGPLLKSSVSAVFDNPLDQNIENGLGQELWADFDLASYDDLSLSANAKVISAKAPRDDIRQDGLHANSAATQAPAPRAPSAATQASPLDHFFDVSAAENDLACENHPADDSPDGPDASLFDDFFASPQGNSSQNDERDAPPTQRHAALPEMAEPRQPNQGAHTPGAEHLDDPFGDFEWDLDDNIEQRQAELPHNLAPVQPITSAQTVATQQATPAFHRQPTTSTKRTPLAGLTPVPTSNPARDAEQRKSRDRVPTLTAPEQGIFKPTSFEDLAEEAKSSVTKRADTAQRFEQPSNPWQLDSPFPNSQPNPKADHQAISPPTPAGIPMLRPSNDLSPEPPPEKVAQDFPRTTTPQRLISPPQRPRLQEAPAVATPPLLAECMRLAEKGQIVAAYIMAQEIQAQHPGRKELDPVVADLYERALIVAVELIKPLERTPRLLMPVQRILSQRGIDHRAGYLLSQLDGFTPIEFLIDLGAMPRAEAALVLLTLSHRGIVDLSE